ncbi:MAG TPA: VOC family protein [Edaphocola sp.]|nr:VOC family protein [Edaphocola sp.]
MLRGIATINFYAANHTEAVTWYSQYLNTKPYFNVPGYSEFRLGDFQAELGIVDNKYAPKNISEKPAGITAYWHVDNLQVAVDKALKMGATIFDPITPRGDSGFVTAAVTDPFGNILGLMYNPHYLEMVEKR